MDIYRFINSRDIRFYLKKIEYQFNTREAAYVVYQSRSVSLEDKISAWEKIINTMPDCPNEQERTGRPRKMGFLDSLLQYVKQTKWDIRDFWENDGFCYFLEIIYDGGASSYPVWEVFSSCEAVFSYWKQHEIDCEIFNKATGLKISKWKYFLTGSEEKVPHCYMEVNADNKIIAIKYDVEGEPKIFKNMKFSMPVPFKQGDIVYNPYKSDKWRKELYVLDDIKATENRGAADIFHGYYLTLGGSYIENIDICGSFCLDLEFYRGDFKGSERVLEYLSEYLRGNLTVKQFFNCCTCIQQDKRHKDFMESNPDKYVDLFPQIMNFS